MYDDCVLAFGSVPLFGVSQTIIAGIMMKRLMIDIADVVSKSRMPRHYVPIFPAIFYCEGWIGW